MSAHWWSVRKTERGWFTQAPHRNGIGCTFTLSILLITLLLKFNQGGWFTIMITSALVPLCCFAAGPLRPRGARNSRNSEADILPKLYTANPVEPGISRPRKHPTAVILVSGFNYRGLATCCRSKNYFPSSSATWCSSGWAKSIPRRCAVTSRSKCWKAVSADDLQSASDLAEPARLSWLSSAPASFSDVVQELRLACIAGDEHLSPTACSSPEAWSSKTNRKDSSNASCTITPRTKFSAGCRFQGRSLVILPVCVSMNATASPAAIGKGTPQQMEGPPRQAPPPHLRALRSPAFLKHRVEPRGIVF